MKESISVEQSWNNHDLPVRKVTALLDGFPVFVFSDEFGEWRCVEVDAIGSNIKTAKALIRLAQQCIDKIEELENAYLRP